MSLLSCKILGNIFQKNTFHSLKLTLLSFVVLMLHLFLLNWQNLNTTPFEIGNSYAVSTRLVEQMLASYQPELLNSAELQINKQAEKKPPPSSPSAVEATPQFAALQPPATLNAEPEISSREILLNPERFLTSQLLDYPAEPLEDLAPRFAQIPNALVLNTLLELWIDEHGRVVRALLIKSIAPYEAISSFQDLIGARFLPALRSGEPVASRKLIEIYMDARNLE